MIIARSVMATTADSFETGRAAAAQLVAGEGPMPELVLTYLTASHDQPAFLAGMLEVLGRRVAVVGCSAQGVIGRGCVREGGYGAALMGLAGDVHLSHGCVGEIGQDTLEKGAQLGRQLVAGGAHRPKLVVLNYDPLCGANVDELLAGLYSEVPCIIVGGAASHSFSYERLRETYQYYAGEVVQRSAVAFAIGGDFAVELGIGHGCAPVGVELTVTRSEGNVLCELDGRPAIEVWGEICGAAASQSGHMAALAVGVPVENGQEHEYLVRAAYSHHEPTGGIVLQSEIAAGTRVMLHHRTVEDVLLGAQRMGESVRERLAGKTVRAVFAFECGARTRPFLGDEATLSENLRLQEVVAPDAPWIGMMPWGEILPIAGRPTFHNYSYPLLAIAD